MIEVQGKDVRKFKNGWKRKHQIVTYDKEMTPLENEFFKADPKFLELISKVLEAEEEVYDYMEMVIDQVRE